MARGVVRRFKTIRATFQNELGEAVEQVLSDLPARVFQHETDHLNGTLYDQGEKCEQKRTYATKAEALDDRAKIALETIENMKKKNEPTTK